MSDEMRCDWFITTDFFDNDGKVYDGWGPFGTQELAFRVRALVEHKERRSDLFIDSRPLSAAVSSPVLAPREAHQ